MEVTVCVWLGKEREKLGYCPRDYSVFCGSVGKVPFSFSLSGRLCDEMSFCMWMNGLRVGIPYYVSFRSM